MKIEKQIKQAYVNDLNDSISRVKKLKNMDDLNMFSWLKSMLTEKELIKDFLDIKKVLIKKLEKKSNKKLQEKLEKLEKIQSYGNFQGAKADMIWVKSSLWGYCPKGNYNNFYNYIEYRSTTGCGYDKLSSLTADMFNNDMSLLKVLYTYIERHNVNKNNIREKLGYGIRMNFGMPYFEGAVGVDCHISILKKIGFDIHYTSDKNYDVISIDRTDKINKLLKGV